MTADWVVPPIQANGPGLEESGGNSSLRDRIAEAINGGPLPEPGCDWEADMYQTQAAAVIAALGLREERAARIPDGVGRIRFQGGTAYDDQGREVDTTGWEFHRRWVTEWETLP